MAFAKSFRAGKEDIYIQGAAFGMRLSGEFWFFKHNFFISGQKLTGFFKK